MPHANASKRPYEVIDLSMSSDNENYPSKYVKPNPKQVQKHAPAFIETKTAAQYQSSTPDVHHHQKGQSRSSNHHQSSGFVYPYNDQADSTQREAWADAYAEVETSQDFDDNAYESFELYGVLDIKVVGVRYYRGQATVGETVIVRREPTNNYDANAIQVLNVEGTQIGHVPRTSALKLAPFMDRGALIVEGTLTGVKGEFDAPLSLKLFGTSSPADQKELLKMQMMTAKLPVKELNVAERERKKNEKEAEQAKKAERNKELQEAARNASGVRKGHGSSQFEIGSKKKNFANINVPSDDSDAGPSMDTIFEQSVNFNPRELGEVVDKYGSGEKALKDLPFADQPKDISTPLLPYQRQGLCWMLDRENPRLPAKGTKDTTQLWKANNNGSHTNIATNYTMNNPKLASGGILADDMGLGKTIQVISLLVADPHRDNRPTLIISPLSVMSNWSHQAATHVRKSKALRILTYHGAGRKDQTPIDLQRYDVVITTYQTMALEWLSAGDKSKPKSVPRSTGLFSLEWRRIVLDEGHSIRNPKSKMAQAACALLAESRWILTGTPIVNTLRDLYSHIKFLRLTGGLEKQEVFSGTLMRPLSQGRPEASTLLQALIATMCLRRMKDMNFIDLRLPRLTSHKYTVAFLRHEREKYDAFATEAKGLLLKYQTRKDSAGNSAYSHLLEVLLRMRQTCNHWKLCRGRVLHLLSILEQDKKVKLTPANLQSLRDLLQLSIDSQDDCAICLETLHSPVITTCGHAFGGECIERVIETQHKCPMCRAELAQAEDLVQPGAPMGEAESAAFDLNASSSKVDALLNILTASRKKDASTKTVIFSQWTSFLDIIQTQLENRGIAFCRLDGTMSAAHRDEAMNALAIDPACTVMLASLSVCSVGLNLVAANQVILSDSWWAPAIEDQAIDRVHRLGQTRPTTVFRLVMEDSIEERVLEIQQEKRKLMMTAFQEKTMKRGNEKSARMADIQKLLS